MDRRKVKLHSSRPRISTEMKRDACRHWSDNPGETYREVAEALERKYGQKIHSVTVSRIIRDRQKWLGMVDHTKDGRRAELQPPATESSSTGDCVSPSREDTDTQPSAKRLRASGHLEVQKENAGPGRTLPTQPERRTPCPVRRVPADDRLRHVEKSLCYWLLDEALRRRAAVPQDVVLKVAANFGELAGLSAAQFSPEWLEGVTRRMWWSAAGLYRTVKDETSRK